ncbi:RagB/SusD family nutrient uptake outer membrane protein [Foetidibacter luteolus]|uniref:RagB/SusD family nutrient uptake outer membrane protein n=1 Tax=Foetidibacter luteolus TaxID=2608880 RepID=UPI00129A3B7A|nr:RagB/SusD family nutrient uptake outer membrane protein [Foetidibacter luteolus]
MKHIFFFSILLTGLALVGCNKKLDTRPTQSIDVDDALLTSNDVKVALVGAYRNFGDNNFYGGQLAVASELLANSNELGWSGTFQGLTQIYNKAIPVDNGFITDIWIWGYRTINDVNNVLQALDVVDEDSKDRVEGEAKFIRGSALFDLVRMYGKAWNDGDPNTNLGVPVVVTPTAGITEASLVKRNKVAEVYTQVIADLTDASNKLPVSNGFFATKIAALAMLSRVYLQQGKYADARDKANEAIELAEENGYRLMSNYADAFPYTDPPSATGNTDEDIFAMQVTTSSGENDFQTYFSALGRGDIAIEDAHLNLYETGDERLNLFYSSGGTVYTGKFDNLYANVPVIRLAELYLTRAEANFRLGTSTGESPADDIKKIRDRVGLPEITAANLTLAAILKERKLELAFEGFNLHDIKRQGKSIGQLTFNSPKLVFPIPIRDIRVNPNLDQNEGY